MQRSSRRPATWQICPTAFLPGPRGGGGRRRASRRDCDSPPSCGSAPRTGQSPFTARVARARNRRDPWRRHGARTLTRIPPGGRPLLRGPGWRRGGMQSRSAAGGKAWAASGLHVQRIERIRCADCIPPPFNRSRSEAATDPNRATSTFRCDLIDGSTYPRLWSNVASQHSWPASETSFPRSRDTSPGRSGQPKGRRCEAGAHDVPARQRGAFLRDDARPICDARDGTGAHGLTCHGRSKVITTGKALRIGRPLPLPRKKATGTRPVAKVNSHRRSSQSQMCGATWCGHTRPSRAAREWPVIFRLFDSDGGPLGTVVRIRPGRPARGPSSVPRQGFAPRPADRIHEEG